MCYVTEENFESLFAVTKVAWPKVVAVPVIIIISFLLSFTIALLYWCSCFLIFFVSIQINSVLVPVISYKI